MTQPPRQRFGNADQILAWFDQEPARILSRCCVFLDVDGTLIEFQADPTSAVGDSELTALLKSAEAKLGGALALVSGRLLATLDDMLSPLRLPSAGLYGFERRDSKGLVHRRMASVQALDAAREVILEFAAAHPGVVAENKSAAIALHYRGAPALGSECRRIVYGAASSLWPSFQVISGSMVVEIVPAGASKATAIEEFMLEPPFANRIPIALGDDFSDCEAFTAVHRHGGLALAVGRRIYGDQCLENCQAARRWLSTLVGQNAP